MASEQMIALRSAKAAQNLMRLVRALALQASVTLPEDFDAPIIGGRDARLKNIVRLERTCQVLALVTGEPVDLIDGTVESDTDPQQASEGTSVEEPLTLENLRKKKKPDLQALAEKMKITLRPDATNAEIIKKILEG